MSKDLTAMFENLQHSTESIEKVLPRVYDELRAIASVLLRSERPGHTLLTTDLVHEAYLRLSDNNGIRFNDKKHFFATAALAMRRVLVDHARSKATSKRTDPERNLPLSERHSLGPRLSLAEVLDLDEALDELQKLDERQCQVVHLRIFAGMTGQETAELMDLSRRTVEREWLSAKAWLYERIGR